MTCPYNFRSLFASAYEVFHTSLTCLMVSLTTSFMMWPIQETSTIVLDGFFTVVLSLMSKICKHTERLRKLMHTKTRSLISARSSCLSSWESTTQICKYLELQLLRFVSTRTCLFFFCHITNHIFWQGFVFLFSQFNDNSNPPCLPSIFVCVEFHVAERFGIKRCQ